MLYGSDDNNYIFTLSIIYIWIFNDIHTSHKYLNSTSNIFRLSRIEWIRLGRPTLVGLCVGAIAGLATITPAAGFIEPSGAWLFRVSGWGWGETMGTSWKIMEGWMNLRFFDFMDLFKNEFNCFQQHK